MSNAVPLNPQFESLEKPETLIKHINDLRDKVKSGELTLEEAHQKFLVLYNVSKQSEPLITRNITYSIQDSVIVVDEDNKICRQIINGYQRIV